MKTVNLKTAAQYKVDVELEVEHYCQTVTAVARDSEYLKVLRGNTDRLQGCLVLAGYDLEGGEDQRMIKRAALAIELLHAYVTCMEQGIDVEQALRAQHEAQIILANLETDEENRLKALGITNRTLMLATLTRLPETPEEDKANWKATELALNPIHVGQVLAGADCHATNRVAPEMITFGKKVLIERKSSLDQLIANLSKKVVSIL